MAKVLIVTDLDGCLLDGGEVVQQYAELLQSFGQAEVLWTFATGRSRHTAFAALKGFRPTANLMIADDGAHVFDKSDTCQRKLLLGHAQVEAVVDAGHPAAQWLNASVKNGTGYHFLLGNGITRKRILEIWGERFVASATSCRDVYLERLAKNQVLRLQVFTNDPDHEVSEVDKAYRMRLRQSRLFKGWQFAHQHANKGSGVQFVQRALGFTPEQTIVVGDADNDVPMFSEEVAHRRVAVGDNLPAELQARMTHQVRSQTTMSECRRIIEELL